MSTSMHIRDLGVTFDGARVLHGVDLDVTAGEWLALLGPNGAGKTTLVRAMSGTVQHTGSVEFDAPAREVASRDGARREVAGRSGRVSDARLRARRVAVVPQTPIIPPGITAFEYVLLGRTPYQGLRLAASFDDRRRSLAVLQRLDLERLATRDVTTLSGGERQRVVLARALVADTPVLVLDEPTAALDLGHQFEILELLAELQCERGLTVVTTLHDLGIAGQFGDRLAVLHDGRIVAHGTPTDVLTDDNIGRWWGVAVTTESDDSGRVSVTVRRRSPSDARAAAVPAAAPTPAAAAAAADDATPAPGH
jgi:iron complex transport system ATP-binding protein